MAKRTYTRRTDQERIDELQAKIGKIQARIESRKRKDSPVVREALKVQRALKKFAQVAVNNGRDDLANSIQAFAAGLGRSVNEETVTTRRRGRHSEDD
jgi:hypothetical protein